MSIDGREQDLLDWTTGELAGERKAAVEAHLRQCAECRAAVRDVQRLSAGLERLGYRTGVRIEPGRGGSSLPGGWPFGRRATWAAAAVLLALAGLPVLLDRPGGEDGRGGSMRGPAATVPARPGTHQLREVESARMAYDPDVLARYARTASSVPVRLAALSRRAEGGPSLDTAELVAAFATDPDVMVRLWVVVEVARSGDVAGARRIRELSAAEGAALAPELQAAIESYLGPTSDPEAAT